MPLWFVCLIALVSFVAGATSSIVGFGIGSLLTSIKEQRRITVVGVEIRGFEGEGGTDQVVNATEGFSIVLCDLKILLESGH